MAEPFVIPHIRDLTPNVTLTPAEVAIVCNNWITEYGPRIISAYYDALRAGNDYATLQLVTLFGTLSPSIFRDINPIQEKMPLKNRLAIVRQITDAISDAFAQKGYHVAFYEERERLFYCGTVLVCDAKNVIDYRHRDPDVFCLHTNTVEAWCNFRSKVVDATTALEAAMRRAAARAGADSPVVKPTPDIPIHRRFKPSSPVMGVGTPSTPSVVPVGPGDSQGDGFGVASTPSANESSPVSPPPIPSPPPPAFQGERKTVISQTATGPAQPVEDAAKARHRVILTNALRDLFREDKCDPGKDDLNVIVSMLLGDKSVEATLKLADLFGIDRFDAAFKEHVKAGFGSIHELRRMVQTSPTVHEQLRRYRAALEKAKNQP